MAEVEEKINHFVQQPHPCCEQEAIYCASTDPINGCGWFQEPGVCFDFESMLEQLNRNTKITCHHLEFSLGEQIEKAKLVEIHVAHHENFDWEDLNERGTVQSEDKRSKNEEQIESEKFEEIDTLRENRLQPSTEEPST